jgi:hypothetical protein
MRVIEPQRQHAHTRLFPGTLASGRLRRGVIGEAQN